MKQILDKRSQSTVGFCPFAIPRPAWAPRGKRAIGSVPTTWGSTTVIAALGLDGVRAPLVFPGATDTQAFQTYVDEVLAPELRPGDVVVFDNLKPHRSPHVAESIGRAGASVLPVPPYSSDYDPIEELWSKFKGELRRVAGGCKRTCTMLLERPWTM